MCEVKNLTQKSVITWKSQKRKSRTASLGVLGPLYGGHQQLIVMYQKLLLLVRLSLLGLFGLWRHLSLYRIAGYFCVDLIFARHLSAENQVNEKFNRPKIFCSSKFILCHVEDTWAIRMSIEKYFKQLPSSQEKILPSPHSSLSLSVPSRAIVAANKDVTRVPQQQTMVKQQGKYNKSFQEESFQES